MGMHDSRLWRCATFLVVSLALAACSGGNSVNVATPTTPSSAPPSTQTVSSVTVLLTPQQTSVGQTSFAAAAARDSSGNIISGLPILWESSNPAIATVSAIGMITPIANGNVNITATIGGRRGTGQLTVLTPGPITELGLIDVMLAQLPAKIERAITTNEDLLPNNPHLADYIRATTADLRKPGLAQEIMQGRQYVSISVTSVDGRSIPVVAVFTRESMRASAVRVLEQIRRVMPIMEAFMGNPYPSDRVTVWYAFGISTNSEINLEDEAGYIARTPAGRLPYEAIVAHEFTHSMMGHERLNQFLEVYAVNMIRHQSERFEDWTYTQRYVANNNLAKDVSTIIDIYRIIGPERMKAAYRRLYPLRLRYGVPLTAEGKQIFVDAAQEADRARVRALVEFIST